MCVLSTEAREGIGSLELELQTAVTFHLGAGSRTQVLLTTEPPLQPQRKLKLKENIRFVYLLCVCGQHVCGSQRRTRGKQFSPAVSVVPGDGLSQAPLPIESSHWPWLL